MDQVIALASNYGMIILWLVQGLIGIAVIHLATKFAGKHTEKKVDDLEDEILIIKEKMKNTPTREDIHALEKIVVETQGDIKRMDETIVGAGGFISRLELQVNRIEDYLKRQ